MQWWNTARLVCKSCGQRLGTLVACRTAASKTPPPASYERSDGIFVSVALIIIIMMMMMVMMMMMMTIMMMMMMQRFDGLLLVLTDSGDTWNCFTSIFSLLFLLCKIHVTKLVSRY